MKSPFFACLLIVSLLTCPLRCVSCETSSAAEPTRAPTACDCCSLQVEIPGSESPRPCSGSCDCHGCICEGAVIESAVEVPVDSNTVTALAILIVWPGLDGRLMASLKRGFREPCTNAARRCLCGRDVRVTHQSWLI